MKTVAFLVLVLVISGVVMCRGKDHKTPPITLEAWGRENPFQEKENKFFSKSFGPNFYKFQPNLGSKPFSIAGYYDTVTKKFVDRDSLVKGDIYMILMYVPNEKRYVGFLWKTNADAQIKEIPNPKSGMMSEIWFRRDKGWIKIKTLEGFFFCGGFEIFLPKK